MSDEGFSSSRQPSDVIGGRYRIVSRLGVGGMGIVYKATDMQLHRAVAVKAVEERRLTVFGAASRLRSEALAVASLDHPYICKVYELVETSTDTFIIMEFVEGETLASMLKRGRLSLMQTLQLGREIAEGLANAHARGVVHRDVKPGNVMVTPHGHVKLLDFGIAGMDPGGAPKDDTRSLAPQLTVNAGTPQYMAPEQAAGQPVTTRADFFSLGVVLYECLTGQLPFSGTTTFDYVRHVIQSAPRRLDKVAPETPSDLVELVNRMLEKTPADRPESADAIVAALRALEDALASPTAGLQTARQARAGRRWQLVAMVTIVVAALAVGWRFIWPRGGAEAPRQLRPLVTTAADESTSRIAPGGEWISFIATTAGTSRVMVQRLDGGESRPLTLGPGMPVTQLWSPDGSQIAAVLMLDGSPVLQVYPAFFGGAPIQSIALDTKLESARLLRWIGRSIFLRATLHGEQGIVVRRMELDSPSTIVTLSDAWKIGGTLRSADVRPDGRAAVIGVNRNGQEDLWTLNVDGSGLVQVTADAFFDKDPLWIGRGDRVVFQSNRGGQVDLWQIDVRTKALTPLTTGDAEEIAESTSADGRIISIHQMTKDASLWGFSGAAARQLTQDSLSDYAPAVSGDGHVLAFQRSQPTPSRGYTILDAKVFTATFDGRPVLDAHAIGDGFAPDLSHDGQWLAYMQISDVRARMSLSVRDLRGGGTINLTRSASLPSLSLAPVDWATRLTAWSRAGADLYFVDQPDEHVIRRYHAGDQAAGPPLARISGDIVRDLYVSTETGRLGYITSSGGAVTVHELDPVTNAVREIATLPKQDAGKGLIGRGWLGRKFVLLRYVETHQDRTTDLDVLLIDEHGSAVVGRIANVFAATTRVDPATRLLYMTRAESGISNVYAFAFGSGSLTALTQNALPGVTFSGFQPIGAAGVLGVREEHRDDIWLLEQARNPQK